MTTEEKFSEAEGSVFGCSCPVRSCRLNVNGRATCSEWREDHCAERLFWENTVSDTGEKPFLPLEPWVSDKDVVDFNYGVI